MKKKLTVGFVYLILIGVTLITVLPLLWVAVSAFKNTPEIFASPYSLPKVWRWSNFSKAWTQGRFNLYFVNTIIVAVPTVAGGVLFSSMCGYALAKLRFPGSTFVTTLLILGLAIPIQAIIIPLYDMLRRLHLLNSLLSISVAVMAVIFPFGILLMRSFFLNIESAYAEAGRIDGCSEFGIFFRIMFPLARSAFLALIVLDFMWAWNAFLIPMLVSTKSSKRVLGTALMFFQSRNDTEYGLVAAATIITAIPIIAVYLAFNRYFVEGLASGGLKG